VDAAADEERVLRRFAIDEHARVTTLLLEHAPRVPLVYDPEGEAVKWIVDREQSRGLLIASSLALDLERTLVSAASLGRPLLVHMHSPAVPACLFAALQTGTRRPGRSPRLVSGLGCRQAARPPKHC
jgi:hypothetical protein